MALNKKGQQIFLSIMMGIIIFILIVILSPVLKSEITSATNSSVYLNASNPNIAVEDRATVIILDMGIFYYIAMMVAASIAYVAGKKSITGAVTAIMVFVVMSVLITPLKSLIVLARDSSHLDCTNAAITVGGKLACIAVDIWLFYFVVAAIAVGISYIFITQALPIIKGEI